MLQPPLGLGTNDLPQLISKNCFFGLLFVVEMPSKPALLGNQDNYRKHDLSLLISLNSKTKELSIYPRCLRICMEAFQWHWWGEVVKSRDQVFSLTRLYIKGAFLY